MLPIYNELLKCWRDLGQEVDIQEGYYWLDKGFIKAFDKSGELHKLYKYKVNDDLTINITKHKEYYNFCPESWEETYQRLEIELSSKINESLDVIKSTFYKLFPPISCTLQSPLFCETIS